MYKIQIEVLKPIKNTLTQSFLVYIVTVNNVISTLDWELLFKINMQTQLQQLLQIYKQIINNLTIKFVIKTFYKLKYFYWSLVESPRWLFYLLYYSEILKHFY